MEQFIYLGALLFAIAGLTIIDWRHALAWWYDAKRTAITIAIGMGVFIIWDIIGIQFNIFFKGDSQYMLPFELWPEFPLEELFFLYLLCYNALILYRGIGKWRRTS